MAPPLKSFLKASSLSGKIIMPFGTHGGGGASSTFKDIAEILPNTTVKDGFVCYGDFATEKELSEWIKSQEL